MYTCIGGIGRVSTDIPKLQERADTTDTNTLVQLYNIPVVSPSFRPFYANGPEAITSNQLDGIAFDFEIWFQYILWEHAPK